MSAKAVNEKFNTLFLANSFTSGTTTLSGSYEKTRLEEATIFKIAKKLN